MGITNGNGNKTKLNLGLGMGMEINYWEWAGMGLKKIFPFISSSVLTPVTHITGIVAVAIQCCIAVVQATENHRLKQCLCGILRQ